MIGDLVDLWRRFVPGTPRIRCTRWYASHAELPTRLPRRALALVGGRAESAKWALLECPCGTGHQIALPLRYPANPVWKVRTDDRDVPSITPSIDAGGQLRCHFWLHEGSIRWSPDRARGRHGKPRASLPAL